MNGQVNSVLWNDFFALETVGKLKKLWERLDPSIREEAALRYYIPTWLDIFEANDDTVFCPGSYLSHDRSAVMLGKAPVIFEGTNQWSWKPYYSTEELVARIMTLKNCISVLREANPDARMHLLLIPEKDYVISQFLLNEDRFNALNAGIARLRSWLSEMGIELIYEQPFYGIDKNHSVSDFLYSDSHLLGGNYISFFETYLASLGVHRNELQYSITLKKLPLFGDLSRKFAKFISTPTPIFQPDVSLSSVTQTAGTKTFADPLGDTWQDFSNDKPLVDQSICLLGDSHCSIYEARKITYLCANVFHKTHFEWNPCGTRTKPNIASYDNVLLEISSRFIV